MAYRSTLLFFLLTLTGCFYAPPTRVDFNTSPNIFRGVYEAEVDLRFSTASVAFNAAGSLLAMQNGDYFHAVQFWDVENARPLSVLGDGLLAQDMALTPDGTQVMAVLPGVNNQPGEARVWSVATGEPILRLPGRSPSCRNCQAHALALSPDGTRVALLSQRVVLSNPGRDTSEVSVFDLETGERLHLLPGPLPRYSTLRFSPDGTRLAAFTGGWEELAAQATLWDVPSGRLLRTFQQKTPDGVQRDAHMWRDGSPVIAAVYNDRLELITLTTGERLHTLPLPEDRPGFYDLYANADATRLLAQYGESCALWNLETNQLITAEQGIRFISGFSPDGRFALTHDGKALILRNAETLAPEKTFVNGEVTPFRIESEATYVNAGGYRIGGTVQFGDDTPVPFEGQVLGHDGEIYVQMSPPRGAELDAYFDYRGRSWHLRSGPSYSSASLSEASGKAVGAWEYYLELDKVR